MKQSRETSTTIMTGALGRAAGRGRALGGGGARRLSPLLLVAAVLVLTGAGGRAPAADAEGSSRVATPAASRMALLRERQKAAGYDFAADATGTLRAEAGPPGSTVAVASTDRGVRLSRRDGGGFELAVETASVGRGAARGLPRVQRVRAERQELVIEREDGVEERFLAGPLGLEQAFVLPARPEGEGQVAIEVAFDGLAPEAIEGTRDRVVLRDAAGRVRGGYRDLVAADAAGRALPAWMEVRGGAVALVIDDAAAAYPLRVDPLVWNEQMQIQASDSAPDDAFGSSMFLDGDTAVVGSDPDNHGYGQNSYIFRRSGTTWTQEAKIPGIPIAVSGDTVLVGTVLAGGTPGSVSVFVRSGTTWTQQGTLPSGALALDGDTALVGDASGVHVYVRSGTSWTQQATLVASDGAALGGGAISGDTVILAEAVPQNMTSTNPGAACVFTRSGTTWTQTAKLVPSDGTAYENFGTEIAVSGSVAVVLGFKGNMGTATLVAYIFEQTGTTWTQAAELTRPNVFTCNGTGNTFVGVSDGTVVFSAHGEQYHAAEASVDIYQKNGTTWTQQMSLTAPASVSSPYGTAFGASFAVSGGTILVGAPDQCMPFNPPSNPPGSAFVYVLSGAAGSQCSQDSDCQSGTCMNGTCAGGPGSGTTTSGGGSSGGPSGGSGGGSPGGSTHSSGGCSYRTPGGGAGEGAAWLGALAAALVAVRRRRRAEARLVP